MTKPKICNEDEKQPAVPEFCDSGEWEIPVASLSDVKQATRDHAYILSDNSIWVLTYDAKRFMPLNGNSSGVSNLPTQMKNTDGYLMFDGNGTYEVTANLNTEKMIGKVKEEIQIPKIEVATDETIGLVKPDGTTITIDKEGTLTSVFPEAPLDGQAYFRKNGQWEQEEHYPTVYYEFEQLSNNQLTVSIATKKEINEYKVVFDGQEISLSKLATRLIGEVNFDPTATERAKTLIQFYEIKNGTEELFYLLDLKPLFQLLTKTTEKTLEYLDKSDAVTFKETVYFDVIDKDVLKQDRTVFFNVNLTSIKAFSFSRNAQLIIGKLNDSELFPKFRTAINMVTENASTAIYANTAIIFETNGDIKLVNTSDVSIGSAYNFRDGNKHFINMTYVTA